MSRATVAAGVATLLLAAALPAGGQRMSGSSAESQAALARGEWPAYAGTNASARYSPLDQINAVNAGSLKIAWRWTSPAASPGRTVPSVRVGSGTRSAPTTTPSCCGAATWG